MSIPAPLDPTSRPVIYQLMLRTFGNTREDGKHGGTLEENGCGKFADVSHTALTALAELGVNTLWLTGVLEQASGTAYPNRPADDPNLLKGIAGSPYAVRDYFDVCPDYALDPDRRLAEFQELLARCKSHGFRVIIDFVPNHVARSYASDVCPEWSFGSGDCKDVFFDRDNHFFYLQPWHPGGGPPLRLPTAGVGGCDGSFPPETEFGRVTGNNHVSWSPSIYDWYETVKLNYGHDFTTGRNTSHLPGPDAEVSAVPRTWQVMDRILQYWQHLGVDGFRADMAHMVPMEFWRWVVKRRRRENPATLFFAEAYDGDPAKLTDANVLDELLLAGFDAVYDSPAYDVIKGIFDHGKWANDLDPLTFSGPRFHKSLRYAENHDEVRLASPREWGGHGMEVGKPVAGTLFALSRGPVLLYNGQEVGERATGPTGFGGDGSRTSIFDYGSMPEFRNWFNHGRCDGGLLTPAQKSLRDWYARLLHTTQARAFTKGQFYGLNHANKNNPRFGHSEGDPASGHWLYAFLRRDKKTSQAFLVVANFHPTASWPDATVMIPEDAQMFLCRTGDARWRLQDRLVSGWSSICDLASLTHPGLILPELPPLSLLLLEISSAETPAP